VTAIARSLETLRRGRRVILQALVVVPAVAALVAVLEPTEYRSHATVSFTGRNTGFVASDARQAERAVERDRSLAARALDVTGVKSLEPGELQDAVQMHIRSQDRLELAINRQDAREARWLADELAYQVARDQRAAWSTASPAVRVAPRLLETALLGLALALPLGVALAAFVQAVPIGAGAAAFVETLRRGRSREG
jgi:hypothetical protein